MFIIGTGLKGKPLVANSFVISGSAAVLMEGEKHC